MSITLLAITGFVSSVVMAWQEYRINKLERNAKAARKLYLNSLYGKRDR